MSKSILIRDLPDELKRQIKIRAAETGRTQKELIIEALKQYLAKPSK